MNTQLDNLAAQWEAAKVEEARAIAARINTEQALVSALGAREEGAETHRGELYKVTITGVLNRRFDDAALAAIAGRVSPELLAQCVRYKPEPIAAGLRYLRNNEVEAYAILAEALTVSPGKPQIRCEFVGEERKAA